MDLNSDLNSVSTPKPKQRGGRRVGAGRPRKSKPDLIPSKEDQIAQIQKLLAANPPAREAVVLTRQLGQLTGQIKTYARTKAEREQPPQEPPRPLSEPLWVRRGNLIEAIADRFANASEQVLTPDEIQAAATAELTPDRLLQAALDFLWDKSHPAQVRFLLSFDVSGVERMLKGQAARINEPGAWVAYLKAYPIVNVSAGPTLSPDELQDVLETRLSIAATKDRARTKFYEQHWERYLRPHKTVSEFDRAHPNQQSILKRSANEMLWNFSDDRLVWCKPVPEAQHDDPNVIAVRAAQELLS